MNKWLAGVIIGVIAATFTLDAEAQRRFGGGRNLGRQSPQVQQRQATPPAQSPQAGARRSPVHSRPHRPRRRPLVLRPRHRVRPVRGAAR